MTSLSRLNKARASAAKLPDCSHYSDWRNWITRKAHLRQTCRDTEKPGILYCDSLDVLGWRSCGDSDSIIRLGYKGWYTDNFQSSTIIGCVLQLPARNGVEQYVPATYHSDFESATVYLNEVTPEKRDAARWADQNAEREGERSREADAQDHAEQQIAEARAEIHRINQEVLPALKDIRGQKFSAPVCSMIRGGVLEHLADRRSAFSLIKKLEADFWQAVPQ